MVDKKFNKIKEFPNYIISIFGEVANCRTGRVLKTSRNQKGYHQLVLSNNGSSRTKVIHRLVFEAFNGDIPKGYEINHIDGDKGNNCNDNLELITRIENMRHAVNIGLIKSGMDCKLSKGVEQIDVITGLVINVFGSQREAEKETGIPSSSISSVCNGHRKTAHGYKWRFML